jgi:hypothetical protein
MILLAELGVAILAGKSHWPSRESRPMSKSGNPYAFVDRDMAADDAAVPISSTNVSRSRIGKRSQLDERQHDLFSQLSVPLPRESVRSGNPYANVPNDDEVRSQIANAANASAAGAPSTATKQEFRDSLTLMFSRYSPVLIRNRLRPHYREFIARNESRTPAQRFEIISSLRKYDLSGLRGLTTYLNRDDDPFTEGVLKAIEETIDGAE